LPADGAGGRPTEGTPAAGTELAGGVTPGAGGPCDLMDVTAAGGDCEAAGAVTVRKTVSVTVIAPPLPGLGPAPGRPVMVGILG
jgi:hypothetical protein